MRGNNVYIKTKKFDAFNVNIVVSFLKRLLFPMEILELPNT